MSNKVLYSEGNIVVTPSRVTIAGDNYFIDQISSSKVRYTVEIDKKKNFFRKALIGGSVVLGGILAIQVAPALGAVVAVIGIIAAFILIKPEFNLYHVYLGLSSGEKSAYVTLDSREANLISAAITEAKSLSV